MSSSQSLFAPGVEGPCRMCGGTKSRLATTLFVSIDRSIAIQNVDPGAGVVARGTWSWLHPLLYNLS